MPASALTLEVFSIPATVFWPYFLGLAILAVGLPVILKSEVPQATCLDKLMPFGRLFYAIPLADFAGEHFTLGRLMADGIPSWIPAHVFLVYFVGVALVAAALSIVVKKYSQLAATLLGTMILLFVVLLHIPRVAANPHDRISWAVALRDLSFSGGAFAFAGAQRKLQSKNTTSLLVTLARYVIAVTAIFFGVEHFLHPEFAPGVPLAKITPEWIPIRLFWAYLAGIVLLASWRMPPPQQKIPPRGNLSWPHNSSHCPRNLPAHPDLHSLGHRQWPELFRRYSYVCWHHLSSSRRSPKRKSPSIVGARHAVPALPILPTSLLFRINTQQER